MVIPVSHTAVGVLLLNCHTVVFFFLFHPPCGPANTATNVLMAAFAHSTTLWILNGCCLIYCYKISSVLEKRVRASGFSLEGKRHIWKLFSQLACSHKSQMLRKPEARGDVPEEQSHFGISICQSRCSTFTCLHVQNRLKPRCCCFIILLLLY